MNLQTRLGKLSIKDNLLHTIYKDLRPEIAKVYNNNKLFIADNFENDDDIFLAVMAFHLDILLKVKLLTWKGVCYKDIVHLILLGSYFKKEITGKNALYYTKEIRNRTLHIFNDELHYEHELLQLFVETISSYNQKKVKGNKNKLKGFISNIYPKKVSNMLKTKIKIHPISEVEEIVDDREYRLAKVRRSFQQEYSTEDYARSLRTLYKVTEKYTT